MLSVEEVVRLEKSSLSVWRYGGWNSRDVCQEKELKTEQRKDREIKWTDKFLHGQYPVKAQEMGIKSWQWLKIG